MLIIYKKLEQTELLWRFSKKKRKKKKRELLRHPVYCFRLEPQLTMAYPSSPPWRITAATAAKKPFPVSTISPCSLFWSTIRSPEHYRKSRLITFSIEPSSSVSSSSVRNLTNNKKQLEIAETFDGFFTMVCSDESDMGEKDECTSKSDRTVSLSIVKKKRKKKEDFWREILFESDKIRSILLLNFITIVYASNIVVVKAAEEKMEPAVFSAMRFVMSAIPFIPFVLRARGDVETRNAGIELGLWVSLGYLIEALALLTSDAGRASFISMFTVIVVPLLDGMLGAIIPSRTWFGFLMSALGVAMLECSGSPPNVGDLLNFLSAIFFGIHMLRTEHFSRSTKKENLLPLLGYEVCVVALLSMIWLIIGGWSDGIQENDPSSWTWAMMWDWIAAFPWIPALYTGVFSTGLCLWVEIAAMRDVSATETAIIYGLEVWGSGFAWFLLGARWGMAGWVGAALMLGGSLMVQIYGTSMPNKSRNGEGKKQKNDILLVPRKQKVRSSLSASPVVVRSKKGVVDMLK